VRLHHGDTITDPYDWLRETESQEVRAYFRLENEYMNRRTVHLQALRTSLVGELQQIEMEEAHHSSEPVRIGEWWYFTRRSSGMTFDQYCRLPVTTPADWTPPSIDEVHDREEVFFDVNQEILTPGYFALGSFDVSTHGDRLAYAVDTRGDERYVLHIRDLTHGTDMPFEHADTAPGATFSADGKHLYFTAKNETWRSSTLWRHDLVGGCTVALLNEPDTQRSIRLSLTRSRRYLRIESRTLLHSRVWLLDQNHPTSDPVSINLSRSGNHFSVEHAVLDGVDMLLVTSDNQETGDTAVTLQNPLKMGNPALPVIDTRSGITNIRVAAFEEFIAFFYRRNGVARAGIIELNAVTTTPAAKPDRQTTWSCWTPIGELKELPFGGGATAVSDAGNPAWQQPSIRLAITSFCSPALVVEHPIKSKTPKLRRHNLPHPPRTTSYLERREWAVALDGTRIPISVVWDDSSHNIGTERSARPTRPAPLLLYGYGAYGMAIEPAYSTTRSLLLKRGVVVAVAHVRGGSDLGRPWHNEGRGLRKKASFTDFVACAQHLIAAGWTEKGAIVAEGHSAGGLLVTAAANMAPELFAGVIAQAPFVDCLTTLLNPNLPLTVSDWDEFGDPLHDPIMYEYIRSYSPYENVSSPYPPVLAIGGINDTRVSAAEPVKWVARLRDAGIDALSLTLMESGHAGPAGRTEALQQSALELSWILDQLQVESSS